MSGDVAEIALTQSPDAVKCAQAGTQMLRRADVISAVRKLIRFAHNASDTVGAEGRTDDFFDLRKRIAAYYEVLSAISEQPVFENPEAVAARSKDHPNDQ